MNSLMDNDWGIQLCNGLVCTQLKQKRRRELVMFVYVCEDEFICITFSCLDSARFFFPFFFSLSREKASAAFRKVNFRFVSLGTFHKSSSQQMIPTHLHPYLMREVCVLVRACLYVCDEGSVRCQMNAGRDVR